MRAAVCLLVASWSAIAIVVYGLASSIPEGADPAHRTFIYATCVLVGLLAGACTSCIVVLGKARQLELQREDDLAAERAAVYQPGPFSHPLL